MTTTTPMPCDATIQQKFSWDGSMFYAVDDLAPPGCGGGSGPPGSGANSSRSVNVATKPSTKTQGATVLVDPGIRETCPAGGSICSAAESARVPASVSAKTQKVLIGQAHFTVPAGTTAKLTFKLNSRGAKLLRKLKTLHVTVTVTSRVANSKPVSTTKQITITTPCGPTRPLDLPQSSWNLVEVPRRKWRPDGKASGTWMWVEAVDLRSAWGVADNIIQRQLGHTDLGTSSAYLEGIDQSEIIDAVRSRRPPTISATAGRAL